MLQSVNDACVLSQPVICLFLTDFQYVLINKMEICYFRKKSYLLLLMLHNLNSMK